ncbi:MAG: hypothetical protein LC102_06680 [Ignavibacteriales bacterium]|nr:MAG: hypothetical protein F9K26_11830 [Ignavibacteriaceae bacterium]MBW7873993.1 hypothetical protein [Ignavibacteria bacterium]MCZ2143094.1 hypothetical protein [Ignavibacteriales bacterium]OQY78763.1 MAG: hypothetical protein B6D45_01930 [Ignavibacteriales bacterium UTCHB3]MBV6443975.1 hypothetical protein [Ignavibacteriaceae bacterium]
MRIATKILFFSLVVLVFVVSAQNYNNAQLQNLKRYLNSDLKKNYQLYNLAPAAVVDSLTVNREKEVVIYLNRRASGNPFRESDLPGALNRFNNAKNSYGFTNFGLKVMIGSFEMSEMVPLLYRTKLPVDSTRLPVNEKPTKVITNLDKKFTITKGLDGRNIAVWGSHGWYYSAKDNKWIWQRARLFGSIEDLLTSSMALPFLVPMLENAGAGVYLPRERDLQTNSVVIDPEEGNAGAGVSNFSEWEKGSAGFLHSESGYEANINPFRLGSFLTKETVKNEENPLVYTPKIPESGEYAVYISFGKDETGRNVKDVKYTVKHSGGETSFLVDQQRGWGTWLYLGTFKFFKGTDPSKGAVVVSDQNENEGVVTSDAVRFGGGMGVVKRNGSTSGRPAFVEAARYYLQYTGAPDTLVYNFQSDKDDYVDDYQARGEYVNWLNGAPDGPNKLTSLQGLNIPIDISLAWHTDAGIMGGDSTVGSLMIYSSVGMDTSFFHNGRSRMANRDLGDIVQTQIVSDIRALFDKKWTRREMWDAGYSEAARPNVPSILLELLAHQNFAEMKFFWHPQFRFHVSRAIYKGMLKFLASMSGTGFVVQPLPVSNFSALLSGGAAELRWEPVSDPLEASAKPTGYVVYRRIGEAGFDNGKFTNEPFFRDENIPTGVPVSYKVTAVNAGGESFPSEVLAVGIANLSSKNSASETGNTDNMKADGIAGNSVSEKAKEVLVVNSFDRLDMPATVNEKGFEGFLFQKDEGVQYIKDFASVGEQTDFDRSSQFKTNDEPGWGASKSDAEGLVIAGNSFDYPALHGEALLKCGFSFSSTSVASFVQPGFSTKNYSMIDIIAGEQKESVIKLGLQPVVSTSFTLFSDELTNKLNAVVHEGKALFISGAYVGSELNRNGKTKKLATDVLKVNLASEFATANGRLFGTERANGAENEIFEFNTAFSKDIYKVEAPQAIDPVAGGETLFRYSDNSTSAVVGFNGQHRTVVAGFPFETLVTPEYREAFMRFVTGYLLR